MKTFTDDIKAEFRKPNNVTVQLILINVIVWALLNLCNLLEHMGVPYVHLIPDQFILPSSLEEIIYRPWTLISFFFSHVGLGHIVSNMLGLWWFGRRLQDLVGSNRVLGIYIVSGLSSGVTYIIFAVILQVIPSGGGLIGASGSAFGIVVALATLSPTYRFNLLFIGSVQVKWIALAFVFLSIIGLGGANAGGDLAHIGGALMGFSFIRLLSQGKDIGQPFVDLVYKLPTLFSRRSRLKVSHRSKKKPSTKNEKNKTAASQKEIDRILDKISQSGYPSLTKEEKDKLFKYSNK
jgi:membrane associated rhomboid family serine protease